MTAKTIFMSDMIPKLMDDFLSNTFDKLYVSGYHALDGAKDFASAIVENTISATYDHTITNGDNLKAFLEYADKTIDTIATRTVYMDSNIALTDGSKLARDGARVIPNLYEAIDGLRLGEEILAEQTKALSSQLDLISGSHGPSTADGGIFIDVLRTNATSQEDAMAYAQLQHVGDNHVIRLRPASLSKINDADFNIKSGNAQNGCDTFGFNIEADEISFTVTNRNADIDEAYEINVANITPENFNMDITTKGAKLTQQSGTKIYYWVPMEDCTVTNTPDDSGPTTYSLKKNDHGKILIKLGDITAVYASHAVVIVTFVPLSAKVNSLKVASKMTYNLGAIIEAIQELNRRTMFMDIDMSFNGAMSYGDYVSDIVTAGAYGHVLDGLPGATDKDSGKHLA